MPEGSFSCGLFLIPALIALIFVLVVGSAILAMVFSVVRWALGRADHKTCPKCAERVRRRAAVCRFCGHEFPDLPPVGGFG